MLFPPPPGHLPLALQSGWSTLVCMLGSFQVFRRGEVVPIRSGGKSEAVLCSLALRHPQPVPRATIIATIWPESEPGLAGQALNSLIYSLHKHLQDDGEAPVVYVDGGYRLNVEAGVGVDTACFDELAATGDREARSGHQQAAIDAYGLALALYRGDLVGATDIYAVMERERLRSRYLTLLARIADYRYQAGDYELCLQYVQRLLGGDPCREDAHRLAMRCYVQLGERSQAFRQYGLCAEMLRHEFNAEPESSTLALFERIRLDPGSV